MHACSVLDFPGGSDSKASVYNAGGLGSSPGLGRAPGEGFTGNVLNKMSHTGFACEYENPGIE